MDGLAFKSSKGKFNRPPGPKYKRPWGIRQNPMVQKEIASLDPYSDCQRIVFLLNAYEFPADITRSLEIGLYHTYGSRSVSRLLDYTSEFERFGQKRYDDTYILIAQFMEAGWDDELGARALAQVVAAHSKFSIKNDDYLFVLWTFIATPISWINNYGWRPLTAHEQCAWYNFWVKIGEVMGIEKIPDTYQKYQKFVEEYELREMVYNVHSRNVSDATVKIMQGWLPKLLRPAVMPVAACLSSPRFLDAIGYKRPSPVLRHTLTGLLKIRKIVKRFFSLEAYPNLLSNQHYPTYPKGAYEIEKLQPDYVEKGFTPSPNKPHDERSQL